MEFVSPNKWEPWYCSESYIDLESSLICLHWEATKIKEEIRFRSNINEPLLYFICSIDLYFPITLFEFRLH